MIIYISASRHRNLFIESVIESSKKNGIQAVYRPWEIGTPQDPTLMDDIRRNLYNADLIFMDMTLEKWNGKLIVNQGTLIEYGIILGLLKENSLHIMAEDSTPLDKLHCLVHKRVDLYRLDKKALKKSINKVIKNYIEEILKEKKRKEAELAYEARMLRS